MSRPKELWIILIDGVPQHITKTKRTLHVYRSQNRAERAARDMAENDRRYPEREPRRYEVGVVAVEQLTEVNV